MLLGRPYWGNHHCGCYCCQIGPLPVDSVREVDSYNAGAEV